ncbi:MAG: hypothetical protein A2X59_12375 [Nitrospirae bacterium GWC2_42_7]|nr:MAG: hypothetical protein A2X59_12375 [Nitrospirae bacterium GWC2_42_7]
MKKTLLLTLAIILILYASGSALANIEFTVKVHQVKETQDSDKKITKDADDYSMTVDIGDDYFSYTKDGTQYVYDFTKKRIITIDLAKKIFADDSLFSDIGFRTYEFQNRLMLGGALAAGGVEDNPMLPVYSEHLFSLQQKDNKSELIETSKDDHVNFTVADKELLSYSKEGAHVTHANKEMFIKFFRYVFGGHPQILSKLSIDDNIPERIRIHLYNIMKEINTLTITSIKTTAKKQFSLENYSPGVLSTDTEEFSKSLNDIKYSKNIDFGGHLALLLSKAKEYYQNQNYIDSILGYLEYSLASGLPLPPIFQEQKAELMKDGDVNKLLTVLNSKSKEEAEEHLAILQGLEKKTKYQGHVLKIFEANTLTGLGKQKEAKELFCEVLKDKPYLVGAYYDLGGIYYSDYNAVMAWRCWDVARKIDFTHKMLIPINEFETNLLKGYPDFF